MNYYAPYSAVHEAVFGVHCAFVMVDDKASSVYE